MNFNPLYRESAFSSAEMARLRRNARFYRRRVLKVIQIGIVALIIGMTYTYKVPLLIIYREIIASYIFATHAVGGVFERVTWIFNQDIKDVVINGMKRTNRRDIVDRIYVLDANGKLKLNNSIQMMRKSIMSIPLIKNVTVRRVMAQRKIVIDIREKNIIGVVVRKFSHEALLLDDVGDVSPLSGYGSRILDVPIVRDIEYSDDYLILYLYLKEKNIFKKLKTVALISNRRWDLIFSNNLLVKLPAKNWRESIDLLLEIDKKVAVLSNFNRIVYIDLRSHGKIFLK